MSGRRKVVKLYTIGFNEERAEYFRTLQRLPVDELPPDALKVRGQRDTYLLDTIAAGNPDINGMSATTLNLWMVNNSINDAFTSRMPLGGIDDLKKLAVVGFVVVLLFCIIYAMI